MKRGFISGISGTRGASLASMHSTCGRAKLTSSRSYGWSSMKATVSMPMLMDSAMRRMESDLGPQPICGERK